LLPDHLLHFANDSLWLPLLNQSPLQVQTLAKQQGAEGHQDSQNQVLEKRHLHGIPLSRVQQDPGCHEKDQITEDAEHWALPLSFMDRGWSEPWNQLG
jgi:hypothetical protein